MSYLYKVRILIEKIKIWTTKWGNWEMIQVLHTCNVYFAICRIVIHQQFPCHNKGPILSTTQTPELLNTFDEQARFKMDLELKADDVDFKSLSYKKVPIEKFGEAMLRGMGWDDNAFVDEDFSDATPNESRLGLGATSMQSAIGRKRLRTDKDIGKQIDYKLLNQSFNIGDIVILLDNSYAGKRASIIETRGVPGLDKIRVALESTGDILDIAKNDASAINPQSLIENPFSYRIIQEINVKRIEEKGEKILSKEGNACKRKKQIHSKGYINVDDEDMKKQRMVNDNWLLRGIRVKVVTKKLGKVNYLRKASVIDVYDRGIASILLDSGKTIENVKASHLETVLPKIGESCLILCGEYAGHTASFLERKERADQVIVQVNDDLTLLQIRSDDVAAFS